jgi:hypothetical protein
MEAKNKKQKGETASPTAQHSIVQNTDSDHSVL